METTNQEKSIMSSCLACCVALQQGEVKKAADILELFYDELDTVNDEQVLASLKNILSTAIRKRYQDFFWHILKEQKERLLLIVAKPELRSQSQEFLTFVIFNVCDRRILEARAIAQNLVEAFTRNTNNGELRSFWNEWTSLIARIARRNWQSETDWLLQILLHQLWRRQDVKLFQLVVWQLQMHLSMYCRFDSIEGMLVTYRKLFLSYLLLLELAGKNYMEQEKRETWLQIGLRGLSEMVIQIARVQMLEEHEVFQQFFDKLVTGEGKTKLKLRMHKLLQLAIAFWIMSYPKSSRRQAKFLDDILQPNYIEENYQRMLEKLC